MLYCEQSRYQLYAKQPTDLRHTPLIVASKIKKENEKKVLIHINTSKQFSKGVLLEYSFSTLQPTQSITGPPICEKQREENY